MSEATNPGPAHILESGFDDVDQSACPRCKGSGKGFLTVNAEFRAQVQCGYCGGTGHYSDCLARALGGVEPAIVLEAKQAIKLREAASRAAR